jgi:hypothetical protein
MTDTEFDASRVTDGLRNGGVPRVLEVEYALTTDPVAWLDALAYARRNKLRIVIRKEWDTKKTRWSNES